MTLLGSVLLFAVLLLALLLAGAAVVVAWRISDTLLIPKPYGLRSEFTVVAYEAGPAGSLVRLPAPPTSPTQFSRTDAEGRYGLAWEVPGGIGHGLLGPVRARTDGWLERTLDVIVGPPPRAGSPARLDITLALRDPLADLGVPFDDVRIRGPVGDIAAWSIDRGSDTAVVMVHGRRRGDRTDTLRALPTVLRHDASVLVTSYRNHDASAASPHGLFTYGQDESADLLAALAWLGARGVRRVAVVSWSMGGAVTLLARASWPADAPTLLGIAMDAPLLDPREVVRRGVVRAGIPAPDLVTDLVTDLALAVSARRAGVRWGPLDLRRVAPGLDVPVLLIGAVEDGTIPIGLLDAFAAAAPADALTYWRVPGAGHVEAFNVDPKGYEARLGAFLERVLAR